MTEATIHAETIEEFYETQGFGGWEGAAPVGTVRQSSRSLIWFDGAPDNQIHRPTVRQLAERLRALEEAGCEDWTVEFTGDDEELAAFGPKTKRAYKEKSND